MKTKTIFKKLNLLFALLLINFTFAQTNISGSVADEQNNPLPGVNIVVQGSNIGTTADFDGNFSINISQELPFSIELSYLGFITQVIQVTDSSQKISVSMIQGNDLLEEVIISANRRVEKVQDAPASISLITARDIQNSSEAIDPVRHLINIPGVTVQQQTANTMNIEMRGGNGLFGTGVYPMLDYRNIVTPVARSFFTYQSGLSNLDLERIEVVRGANSALYGPGVEAGVVHFLTKKAIDYPGTTAELYGGNMSSMGGAVRHAFSNDSKTFGYKVNVKYSEGDDFTLDPNEDAEQIASFQTTIKQPAITNNVVDATLPGKVLLNRSDLDPDGDGNPLQQEYRNISANVHLEFRPNSDTSGIISGGIANGSGIFINDQGFGLTQGNDMWGQARLTRGNFFAQIAYTYNDGGDEDNPTFLYSTGNRVVSARGATEALLQYNFDIPFLDTNFIVGLDYRNTTSDSEYTLYGNNENDSDYGIMGGYIQGTSSLGNKLKLTYALRRDKMSIIDKAAIAPRVALVYKADERNSFRVSYSRSTTGPSALESFIDFPVATLAPGILDVWLAGNIEPHIFDPNAPIELTGLGTSIPRSLTGLPAAIPYAAVKNLVLPQVYNGLTAAGQGALVPFITDFFSTYQGPSGVIGQLAPYNLFNPSQAMPTLDNVASAQIAYTNGWEVGYKGLLGDKLSLAVDVYTFEREGFIEFTGVGPTYALVGGDIPGTLSQVGADLVADPTIQAVVGGAIKGAYNNNGLPLTGLSAAQVTGLGLGDALEAVGLLAGDGSLPSADLATQGSLASLSQQVGGGFALGGQGFEGNINRQVIGAVESNRAPNDGVTHSMAGYRNYPDAKRSHWGTDVAVEYFANDNLTLWANYSYISQNQWIPGESNDDDLPFPSYLNTPLNKYRMGVKFSSQSGIRAGLAFQHDDAFFSNFGQGLGGDTPERNLLDFNVGFPLTNKIGLDLQVTNLANVEYRAYPGLPVIKRRAILKATFDF